VAAQKFEPNNGEYDVRQKERPLEPAAMEVQLHRPLAPARYPLAARPGQERPARRRRGAMRKNAVTRTSINQKTPARKLVHDVYQLPRGDGGRRLARRQSLAAGPLLLAPTLAALTAAALLTAALAATLAAPLAASLAAAPAVAALAAPLDRVDLGGLVLILLAFHHGDRSAVLVPVQGKQAVRLRRQPPDIVLVVAFQLDAQPGGEPLQEKEHEEAAGLLVVRAQLHHLRQEL
jgi:hypothetical protein